MRVVHVLERLGGVADRATLVRLTSRAKLDAALRIGDVVRDSRGRYALPAADQAVRAANALSAVVSHGSAAAHWGWEMKQPPQQPSMTVPRNRNVAAERRVELSVKWADLSPEEIVNGILTSQGRTVIDCAKTMPFDHALAIADSALRHRNITSRRLLQLAEAVPGRGRAACLRVAREANGKAANPFESVLRAISLDVPGLDLRPQVVISEGGPVVRPDLVDENLRLVVEADSFEWHGKRNALKKDCERYNALVLLGWTVLRFSWEHVMFEPCYVDSCLREYVHALSVKRATGRRAVQIPA